MQLKNRYYPYPVITEDGEYYEDSSFSSRVLEYQNEGYNFKLKMLAELKDNQLLEMVQKDEVIYAHHIECPQTCYRRVFCTKDAVTEIMLKDSDINGLVQVCSFLVANKDIERYSNESFAADYRGWKFNIEKGCFLAIGNQSNIQLDKLRDDLSSTSSIFSIVKNTDPLANTMNVNLGQKKITILLPEETYNRYCIVQDGVDMQPIMHSMIIVPALIYVFAELREAGDQLFEYENYRWYRGLKKACQKLNIILDEETLKSVDILRISQLLLNTPLTKAVEYCALGDEIYED